MNIIKTPEAKWFKFKGSIEFLIRPFRLSTIGLFESQKMGISRFKYVLIDWKAINESNGKNKLEVTDENKEILFDFYPEIREFIINESEKMVKGLGIDLKN